MYLFTREVINPKHPDKYADSIVAMLVIGKPASRVDLEIFISGKMLLSIKKLRAMSCLVIQIIKRSFQSLFTLWKPIQKPIMICFQKWEQLDEIKLFKKLKP